jgi:hypothetical protein
MKSQNICFNFYLTGIKTSGFVIEKGRFPMLAPICNRCHKNIARIASKTLSWQLARSSWQFFPQFLPTAFCQLPTFNFN